MSLKNFIKYWLPALVWSVIIFGFSSKPTIAVSESYWFDVVIKKLAHVTEYFIFTTLFYRAFLNSGNSKIKSLKISFLLAIFYAFTDEFHQSFTPSRTPHIRDVIFDTIGASIASVLIWKYIQKLPKPLKKLATTLDLLSKEGK